METELERLIYFGLGIIMGWLAASALRPTPKRKREPKPDLELVEKRSSRPA